MRQSSLYGMVCALALTTHPVVAAKSRKRQGVRRAIKQGRFLWKDKVFFWTGEQVHNWHHHRNRLASRLSLFFFQFHDYNVRRRKEEDIGGAIWNQLPFRHWIKKKTISA